MIKQYLPNQTKPILIKRIFWRIVTKLNIANIIRLFIYKDSYLIEQGWFKSVIKAKSIDKNGQSLPWLTYPLISFIEPRLNKTFFMFEYGSGDSTIWFSDRVREVHSVEHNKVWYNVVSQNIPENVTITLREINITDSYSAITYMDFSDENSYSTEIKQANRQYDIILIDGVYRNNCIVNAVKFLKPDGVFIVDNIDYIESDESTTYLLKLGFKKIEFWGMCPIVHHDSCTAIFYKNINCLNI